MASDMTDYIVSHYLVADSKPSSKKRKLLSSSRLVITDDDSSTWARSNRQKRADEDDAPVTFGSVASEFRRAKKNKWKKVETQNALQSGQDEQETADAVLDAVSAEKESKKDRDVEPAFEGADELVKMSDGTHAGLQTGSAVSAQLRRRQREEQEQFKKLRQGAKEEETIYRDATGRRIDISMKRAEARNSAAKAQMAELQSKEALKGEVQLQEARQRAEALREARSMNFSRTADDELLNKELKEMERWDDPMRQLMNQNTQCSKGQSIISSTKRPAYLGAAAPNRYGIKPGYRWDGVDRGNSFEAQRFKALKQRERNKAQEYFWQMDD